MKPLGITVHCSDSPQGRGDNAETIHKWHNERGWDGIGYHYVILEDGTIENGRPDYWMGSHCRGHNNTLGICLIGEDSFTEEQYDSLHSLIDEKTEKYGFGTDRVHGHYKYSSKTCPNFDVQKYLSDYGLI